MGLKPLHDWALIRRDKQEEKTAGGIIIPASARSEPSQGVVEAIGPGRYKKDRGKKEERFVPTVLKPGQWVFFPEYAARDVELDGREVTLIREEDILGTFEGQPRTGRGIDHTERRKEAPPAELPAARGPEVVGLKKPAAKKKPGKAEKPRDTVKKTAAPKKKTKTASTKKPGKKKLKAEKTVSAKKTPKKTARKKTGEKTKKATTKKSTAKKTVAKKAVPKKTAPKRAASRKKAAGKR